MRSQDGGFLLYPRNCRNAPLVVNDPFPIPLARLLHINHQSQPETRARHETVDTTHLVGLSKIPLQMSLPQLRRSCRVTHEIGGTHGSREFWGCQEAQHILQGNIRQGVQQVGSFTCSLAVDANTHTRARTHTHTHVKRHFTAGWHEMIAVPAIPVAQNRSANTWMWAAGRVPRTGNGHSRFVTRVCADVRLPIACAWILRCVVCQHH